MKKICLSGLQPSGILHIGNYFGALKQCIDLQKDKNNECLYFIADYHALTSNPNPKDLKENTYNAILDFLALGIDPNKSSVFLQSHIPRHLELAWILSNVTPIGLLERGHAYKDKISKGIKPNIGLFTYPILMASDILMYNTDLVPVGKDQIQHIEFTRDIATKFNEFYSTDYFKLPEALILNETSIVPGVDGNKMSKSYKNTINMFSDKKTLKKQIMSIVTDSTPLEEPKNPNNLITDLYSLFSNEEEIEYLKERFKEGNFGYGHAKTMLLDKILEYFKEAREKRDELLKKPQYIEDILEHSKKIINEKVEKRMDEIKCIVGLYN